MCYNYAGHSDHIEPLTRGIASSLQPCPATRYPYAGVILQLTKHNLKVLQIFRDIFSPAQ